MTWFSHCSGQDFVLRSCDGKSRAREIWRLRCNFLVLLLLRFAEGNAYFSVLSSFHQFVTNPTAGDQVGLNTTAKVPAGLGESEFFYSWAVSMYAIGEVMFAPLTGVVIKFTPYWYTILFAISIYIIGYLIYLLSNVGWMILLARMLIGGFASMVDTVVLAYFSEDGQYYQQLRDSNHEERSSGKSNKARVKETLFALFQLGLTISFLFGAGISAILAQFPDVDQFRWVAWYNITLGLAFIVIYLIFFRGESKWKKPALKWQWRCSLNQKYPKKETTGACNVANFTAAIIFPFFVYASYETESSYAVSDTLVNPILADYFGFTEIFTTYFYTGKATQHIAGTVLVLVLLHLKFNSRIIAIAGFTASINFAALIADWQSIGYDPCTQFSLFHHPDLAVDSNYSQSALQLMYSTTCENRRSCYWNQHSIITGQDCWECPPICRGVHRSLNFIQFCLGMTIFTLAIPISRVTVLLTVSDYVSMEAQGPVMGIMVAAAGASRVLTPVWIDAAYEVMMKRTFLAMVLVIAATLPVLLGLAVLYQKLLPKASDSEQKINKSSERDASGSECTSDEEEGELDDTSLMVNNSK